jgi:hypothetical protein
VPCSASGYTSEACDASVGKLPFSFLPFDPGGCSVTVNIVRT